MNLEINSEETAGAVAPATPCSAHCSRCKYSIREDNGYSNWTVEGCDIDCLKKLNPKFPVDAWYGECPEGDLAQTCPSYTEGDGVNVDVEHEMGPLEAYSEDPEIKELLRLRES